ncbi:MAG: two pore domain potassium channel family protein [Alphaproteobacteria bacterium]|nr:two pore domain potassium channel family protein [Alphaproteobacteria bacterium]
MFLLELIIGAVLIGITVIIHALALDYIIRHLESAGPWFFRKFRRFWKTGALTVSVLGVFMAHIVQIWLWALFYFGVSALPTFEECLYFSTSSFTTVGFGDVVLEVNNWRLISSFQSANGFILFGWSTAFIFEIMSRLYETDPIKKNG